MENETRVTYPQKDRPIEIRMYDARGEYIKVVPYKGDHAIDASIAACAKTGYTRTVLSASSKTVLDFAYALIEMFGEGQ